MLTQFHQCEFWKDHCINEVTRIIQMCIRWFYTSLINTAFSQNKSNVQWLSVLQKYFNLGSLTNLNLTFGNLMYDFTSTRLRIRMSIIFHAAFYKDPNWLSTHKILWPIHLVATTSGYSSHPFTKWKNFTLYLKNKDVLGIVF